MPHNVAALIKLLLLGEMEAPCITQTHRLVT